MNNLNAQLLYMGWGKTDDPPRTKRRSPTGTRTLCYQPGRWLEQGCRCLIPHHVVSHGGSSLVLIYSAIHPSPCRAESLESHASREMYLPYCKTTENFKCHASSTQLLHQLTIQSPKFAVIENVYVKRMNR